MEPYGFNCLGAINSSTPPVFRKLSTRTCNHPASHSSSLPQGVGQATKNPDECLWSNSFLQKQKKKVGEGPSLSPPRKMLSVGHPGALNQCPWRDAVLHLSQHSDPSKHALLQNGLEEFIRKKGACQDQFQHPGFKKPQPGANLTRRARPNLKKNSSVTKVGEATGEPCRQSPATFRARLEWCGVLHQPRNAPGIPARDLHLKNQPLTLMNSMLTLP